MLCYLHCPTRRVTELQRAMKMDWRASTALRMSAWRQTWEKFKLLSPEVLLPPSVWHAERCCGLCGFQSSAVKWYLILQKEREAAVNPISLSVRSVQNTLCQNVERPRSCEHVWSRETEAGHIASGLGELAKVVFVNRVGVTHCTLHIVMNKTSDNLHLSRFLHYLTIFSEAVLHTL